MILKSIMNTADIALKWDSRTPKPFKKQRDISQRSRKHLPSPHLAKQLPIHLKQVLSGSISARNHHSRIRSMTDMMLQPLGNQSSRLLYDGLDSSGNTPLKSPHFRLSKKSTAASPIKILGPHHSSEFSKAELSTPVRGQPTSFLMTYVGDASMEHLFVRNTHV
jgi:hypothetical protein